MRLINANALAEVLVRHENDGRLLSEYEYGVNSGLEIAEMEIDEAPTVDAVPVALIKELLTRLRRRRKNLDDDCVDEAWNLKMQIEALEDLLNEWAWRKEE